jgi:hypothetical protein
LSRPQKTLAYTDNKSDSSDDVHSVGKLFKNNHGRVL